MSRLVYGEDARVAAWVSERCPGQPEWDHFVAIGLEKDGELLAGCVYTHQGSRDIMAHIAGTPTQHWLHRSFLRAILHYPFVQLGLPRITAVVTASNVASRKFLLHLGFRLEGAMREGGERGEDLLLFGLLSRECRWIERLSRVQRLQGPSYS